ncbi:PAC2 family protein [Candidatus Aerophobetes bacterium]|uniref:PAC2 family protein n=1 Tax=Aerophobetes bacterium TaxID=2030807 RepID=A0A523YQQ2_UNCAE|nr:MAG: PAC2 family protein [Candidatus Aerophobetes bacterium]
MESLRIYSKPKLKNPRMVIGFSGWMDGGDVSTGTIQYLRFKLQVKKFAEIDVQKFYLFNFPGEMRETAQFRPYTKIQDGLITDFQYPQNEFFYDEKNNLILFSGKEPNINWDEYANCIFKIAQEFGVKKIYFVGSVAGPTPHTRGIRISCSVSGKKQKAELKESGIRFSNYQGPASLTTLLTKLSPEKGIEMTNFVAEIPVYVQTRNPKGIKAVTEKLVQLLKIDIDLTDLSVKSTHFEKRIDGLVHKQPLLATQIKKLEENYDKEYFEEKGGFEEWLKRHGIDKL